MSRAFIPGFDHDVFVSYAHVDNASLEGVPQGWVSTFARMLELRLKQKLGTSEVSLWMDHRELRGNQALTPQIMEALRRTATFVVVVSPGYLRSEWCRAEREQFFRLMKERTDSGSRVFLIELDQVERDRFPRELSDLVGYRFWILDPENNVPHTLGSPVPTPADQEYYRKLNRLSADLAAELTRLGEAAGAGRRVSPVATPRPAADGGAYVYLAEVTDDLEPRRDEVKDYLGQLGLEVLPATWQRHDDLAAYHASVDVDLARCSVVVQLLSQFAGKRPFGQANGFPRLQYERAAAAGKPILQWRDPNLDMTIEMDPDQRALLEGHTVRAETMEEFKRAVVDAVMPKESPPPPPAPVDGGRFIFVSADRADRSRAEEIVRSPIWRRDVGYVFPPEVDDPAVVRQFIEVSLLNCDAVMLVYCETDPASLLSQLMQCRKVLAQREPPLPAIAVYDGPPPPSDRATLEVMLPNLRHLNCRADSAALQEFLRSVSGGA